MAGTSYSVRPGDWQALRDLANVFRSALEASAAADLERFLPPVGDRLRPEALVELIEIDLAFHWQRGRGPLLDDYLKRFPELGPPAALAAKFVYTEYSLRRLYGDRPSLDTYKRRFPVQFTELENLAIADATVRPPTTPVPCARADTPVVADAPAVADDAWATNPNLAAVAPKSAAPQVLDTDAWATKVRAPAARHVDGPQGIAEGATLPFGGGYTLIDRLGSGSFGEVWRARSAGGGFENAIKVIFRSEDEDIQREVHALEVIRELRHPYLLSTQSFWFLGRRLYIVMELADCSLRQALRPSKQADAPGAAPKQLLSYLGEAAEALDFLHARGIMHRDIKPENILVLEGHVKVADFGVVRLQEGRAESATVLGTPQYMPPEVWGGQVSIHSDQYSLALTYAELRLGRRTFTASGFSQLMQAHCGGDPDLGGMSDLERQVMLRALAKDPEKRFPSCGDFARALDAAIHPPAVPDLPRPTLSDTAAPAQASPARRRPRAVYALVFCVLLLAAAGLVWAFVPVAPPPADTLQPPAPVSIHAGEQVTIRFFLERAKRDGSLVLKCTNLPNDVQIEPNPIVIPDGGTEAPITLKVGASAEAGTAALIFESPSGASATLDLIIHPLATVPVGCFKESGTAVRTDVRGKNYYKTVNYLLPDKTPIAFCLVEQEKPDDPPSFYIMRDKVTNDLHRKSVAWREGPASVLPAARALGCLAAPDFIGAQRLLGSFTAVDSAAPRWALGGTMVVKAQNGETIEKDVGAADRLPVLRVTAFEAHWFARWIGGRLPSIPEWDRAAGRGQLGRQGPFEGDWNVLKDDPTANLGVGRTFKGPLSVDDKTVDVSYFGCRHMSGNGKEWTNDLQEPARKTLSEFAGRTPTPMLMVLLRGRGYTRMRPVLFETLDTDEMTAEAEEAHPEIGFRVVIQPH